MVMFNYMNGWLRVLSSCLKLNNKWLECNYVYISIMLNKFSTSHIMSCKYKLNHCLLTIFALFRFPCVCHFQEFK